jgi:hypothetical protein
MKWYPEAYSILLPDPYDPKGSWDGVGPPGGFKTEAQAIRYLMDTFGADAEGRIGLISKIHGEGWLVDLPNPASPEGAWIFVESFPRKRDAVRFVKKHYDGDAQGRIRPIDVMYGESGPKDWSPIDEVPGEA